MFSGKYMSKEEILEILSTIEAGYKDPSDPLFIECNKLEKPFKKLGVIRLVEENELHHKNPVTCNIPGCNQIFDTVFEYETHYNSLHRYLCSTCKKNLPSAHLLDLHVSEKHDSFFAAQAERKPMYSCYLAQCSHKSLNSEERKDHCIKEHKFPPNFRFETSISSSTTSLNENDNKNRKLSEEKKDMTNEHGAVKKENKSNINYFSFGHHRTKVFDGNKKGKNKKTKNKLNNAMEVSPLDDEQMVTDLLESLPDLESK